MAGTLEPLARTAGPSSWSDTRAQIEHPITNRAKTLAADDQVDETALEFVLIQDRAQFNALEHDWNGLFDRAGRSTQVFQTFNWNWHWANHHLNATSNTLTLAVVTARRAGQLVLVMPLICERMHGIKVLSWMGEPVSQYGDVLIDENIGPANLRTAWNLVTLTLKPDLARLNKTRIDASVAPLLAELGSSVTQVLEAPFLDLKSAPTFDAYETRFAAKARKNRKRQRRRLEEQGEVYVRSLSEGTEARHVIAQALSVKREWLAQKGLVSPALTDERTRRFFEDVASSTARPTNCRISVLSCGGTNAAFEIAFGCKGRMAIHIMAYAQDFEKSGAGAVLLETLLHASMNAGVETYDLLAPGDGYKKEWADGAVGVNDYAVELTLKGKVYTRAYLAVVRPKLKAAINALPTSWRRAVSQRLSSALLVLGGVS
jgi:CelD/BcsL family acetyltransferase involved in cellulose biosynthesis